MWLKQHPWNYQRRGTRGDYEMKALEQGHIAINSILCDWVKGQMTAIESGMLSFEAVFMPFMLTSDGQRVIERVAELLPEAESDKVVALPSR
jgi:inhibitor of KinA sporulation pathway (predicted exonuclease)